MDVEVVKSPTGEGVVKINNIIFRGKQNINWKAVEIYLQQYIGRVIEISDEKVYIDRKFTSEYSGSKYTQNLKGGLAKAKANAAQGIVEMLKIAILKKVMQNKKEKHFIDAKRGWKYYKTKFAIPVYHEETKTITYNIYQATLIIRYSKNGKAYLYDMQEIKKETGTPSWI